MWERRASTTTHREEGRKQHHRRESSTAHKEDEGRERKQHQNKKGRRSPFWSVLPLPPICRRCCFFLPSFGVVLPSPPSLSGKGKARSGKVKEGKSWFALLHLRGADFPPDSCVQCFNKVSDRAYWPNLGINLAFSGPLCY